MRLNLFVLCVLFICLYTFIFQHFRLVLLETSLGLSPRYMSHDTDYLMRSEGMSRFVMAVVTVLCNILTN